MTRPRIHTHPCADCHTPTECDGTWESNDDGWPEAICDLYHQWSGWTNPDHICETCREAREREALAEHSAA